MTWNFPLLVNNIFLLFFNLFHEVLMHFLPFNYLELYFRNILIKVFKTVRFQLIE